MSVGQKIDIFTQGRGEVGVRVKRHAHMLSRCCAEDGSGQQSVNHATQGQGMRGIEGTKYLLVTRYGVGGNVSQFRKVAL